MIPAKTFVTFMMTLEDNYLKDNPFHNSTHAADVTQSTNVLLNSPALEVIIVLRLLYLLFTRRQLTRKRCELAQQPRET